MAYALQGDQCFVAWRGRQTAVDDRTLASAATGGPAGAGLVRAPMAGRIVALQAVAGQSVARGATLAVLEAMKMEHPSLAPIAGVVARVCVEPGAQVAAGTLLVEIKAAP